MIDFDKYEQFFQAAGKEPPDGEYDVTIIDTDMRESSTGHPMLVSTLRIEEGLYSGRNLYKYNTPCSVDAAALLVEELGICEFTYEGLRHLSKNHHKLQGCVLNVTKGKDRKGHRSIRFNELLDREN